MPGGPPDLVVFVTDGDPTLYNTAAGPGTGGTGSTAHANDLIGADRAVAEANLLKRLPAPLATGQLGSHIFVVGVGPVARPGAGAAASEQRIQQISGPNQFFPEDEQSDFRTADYTLEPDFDKLKTTMARIVVELCGGTLTITKRVWLANGTGFTDDAPAAQGWRFTATLNPSEGHTHSWVTPPRGERPSATRRTDADGRAFFEWELTGSATLTVHEHPRRGFVRPPVLARCDVVNANGTVTQTRQRTKQPIATLPVPRDGIVTCTVENRQKVAHLKVVKRLRPRNDPGRFDLRVDGHTWKESVGNRGRTAWLKLGLGTHTVSEEAAEGTMLDDYSISTRCVNRTTNQEVASGVGTESDPVAVRLRRQTDRIVCTITNRRPGAPPPPPPPPPPNGTTPPPPCLDVDDDIPVCGDLAAAPNLVVTKRMPARAHVGDRVRVTITVQNVGRGTARTVRLHETPARGGRIARVAQRGSIRSDGTAVWNLRNLAPGAQRTVRATMRVTRTGLHMNTAVAAAANAEPAFDVAGVRARRRPPPPPVTG